VVPDEDQRWLRQKDRFAECYLRSRSFLLLRATGYRIVEDDGNDPTLETGSAGLNLHGRGTDHQIDAIADFIVQHPFSNPQRLLVEAKCYERNTPVGLPVVRNALGTLRDVSEFWVRERPTGGPGGGIPRPRYHYQYAVFSATRFTSRGMMMQRRGMTTIALLAVMCSATV